MVNTFTNSRLIQEPAVLPREKTVKTNHFDVNFKIMKIKYKQRKTMIIRFYMVWFFFQALHASSIFYEFSLSFFVYYTSSYYDKHRNFKKSCMHYFALEMIYLNASISSSRKIATPSVGNINYLTDLSNCWIYTYSPLTLVTLGMPPFLVKLECVLAAWQRYTVLIEKYFILRLEAKQVTYVTTPGWKNTY